MFVANHHTGPMAFPRTSDGNVMFSAVTIEPGCVAEIPDELWDRYKKTPVIQFYLDRGLLTEVRDAAKIDEPVLVGESRTSNLIVPEHLRGEEQSSPSGTTAKVKRQNKGTVVIGGEG